MSRIDKAFEQKVKVAYLTAGDGNSLDYCLALIEGGVTLLEIGMPFSDPIADGPVIQRAMQRSLKQGMNQEKLFALIRALRQKTDIPIILFSYFNPIQANLRGFLSRAKESGVDGILIVDLPYEEGFEFRYECRLLCLAPISVASPSTPLERISLLAEQGEGFLYYACRKGTTGEKKNLPIDLESRIQEIKKSSKLPIIVGFGLSDKESVGFVLDISDGCVVGSYFVSAIERQCSPKELKKLAQEIFVC